MRRIPIITLLLLALSPLLESQESPPAFDDFTRQKLDEALACVNLDLAALGWDKRPISDDFRLACVNETLDRPTTLADRALRAEREFEASPLAAAHAARAWLDLPAPAATLTLPDAAALDGAPAGAAPLLAALWSACVNADAARTRALGSLSDAERALLRDRGAALYVDESEEEWDQRPVLDAARKVALPEIAAAAVLLALAEAQARERAAGIDPSAWTPRTWTVDGVTIALGGLGPDTHTATVVVDPGGDDTYGADTRFVLDLAGDDTYRGAGAAVHACALIVDRAGNDRYLGGNFVQGGALFAASLLVDDAGDDRYEADQCSQGAGVFGIGLLIDRAGQDAYRGARFVQGFGGTRGFGALSDVAGDDTYYAGGKYRHAPLLPENYQSLSQGFGFGLRGANTSGGVGVLADHAGNDVYAAEVFGQGASYWFSLGILADSAGHDKYVLYHYGQGSGIHLSTGVLFDRAGNDAYSCNNGVAQGCGHDWAVGLLWDLEGDDYYQGSGLSHGGANANGIGILVDRRGNDAYSGMRPEIQGFSFESRGTLGLGLLLDLGGADRYTTGGKDNAIWTRSTVGVGLDAEEPK